MLQEEDTRHIPYSPAEYAWAHERLAPDRTPIPAPGDEVCYRHDDWGPVLRADVLSVQPLDDLTDPHLWRPTLDDAGSFVLVDGRPVYAAQLDPWPTLILHVPGVGNPETREARLRGSAGWLPLDWQTRNRPNPAHIFRSA